MNLFILGARHDLEEPNKDVTALLSHAVQERLKTVVEKLSVIAEHRLDIVKVTISLVIMATLATFCALIATYSSIQSFIYA